MKKGFSLLVLLGSLASAYAQGTLQFATQLTNSLYSSSGSFTLTGNNFHFGVVSVGLEVAEIHGPGTPATNAPIIFNLALIECDPPLGNVPGACYFSGNL